MCSMRTGNDIITPSVLCCNYSEPIITALIFIFRHLFQDSEMFNKGTIICGLLSCLEFG
jgi:hypothetical protein